MPNPNLKTISPSFFSKKSGEEQIDEKKLDSYKLANISLVAFLGIINHFSNYQNQELDNEKPDYKNKLIESVFSLNDDDEKNLNPEYFKLLARYTPEGFGKKIPNLSNSGIELWVVKMKSRLDQEKLFALVDEIKIREVSPKTIQSAISIKIDKPSQIWIDESIYQRYLDLKQSWKHEKDQVKQKEIGEEFLIYKSMQEVAINQEDSYSGKLEQEKVKLAGLEDEEIKNTGLEELQEKQELNFVEKRLQNRCMELWSMQENIFNPELRNKDNLKPMKVKVDFVTENDSSDHFNY